MTERDIVERAGQHAGAIRALYKDEPEFSGMMSMAALIDELSAEITRLREMVTWRPIESAPKEDDATVLIWRAGTTGAHQIIVARSGDEWVDHRTGEPFWSETFTHWLPLPEPPGDKQNAV